MGRGWPNIYIYIYLSISIGFLWLCAAVSISLCCRDLLWSLLHSPLTCHERALGLIWSLGASAPKCMMRFTAAHDPIQQHYPECRGFPDSRPPAPEHSSTPPSTTWKVLLTSCLLPAWLFTFPICHVWEGKAFVLEWSHVSNGQKVAEA